MSEIDRLSRGEESGEPVREMLRDSARQFAEARLAANRLRVLRAQDTSHDPAVWLEMVALGWSGLMVDDACGGSGLGLSEMVLVLEEMGRRLAPEPLAACGVLAATAIRHSDQHALRNTLLEGLADGRLLPALAWQDDEWVRPASTRTTSAVPCAAGWRLDGAKRLVRPGCHWSGLVVAARCAEGTALFWVPSHTPGLSSSVRRLADGTLCVDVAFDNVRLDEAQMLASPDAGAAALEAALAYGRLAAAAELLGLVRGALDIAFEQLRSRRQFGVAIGSFQALRHRAVDLYLQQELSAAALAEACDLVDRGESHPSVAARVKARASDAALWVTKEAVQFHGAMGYTDECDIGLYLKRALSLAAWLGNGAELRALHPAHPAQGQRHPEPAHD